MSHERHLSRGTLADAQDAREFYEQAFKANLAHNRDACIMLARTRAHNRGATAVEIQRVVLELEAAHPGVGCEFAAPTKAAWNAQGYIVPDSGCAGMRE